MKNIIVRRKLLLKIFCLFFGVFIWMYVVSSAIIENEKSAQIKIQLPKGLAIKNEMVNEVTFRFKGPALFLREFINKDLQIEIKSKRYYKKGRYRYTLNMDNFKFKLPIGVEITSIEPRYLNLELEKEIEKWLEVKAVFADDILSDYNIKELITFPRKVLVRGPKSLLRGIKHLDTKLIEKLDTEKGHHFLVEIDQPDLRLSMDDTNVNISYTLQSKNIEFTYTEVPIIFQSVSLIKSALPKVVKVKVFGEEAKIKTLSKDSIQIIAFVPKGSVGQVEVELITELPPGLELVEITPKKVNIGLE